MEPNIILNLLWRIPTVFWHYIVYKPTGYVFAARVEDNKIIAYYFDRYHQLPSEFKGNVPR
jgi:hypothetical protein